MNRQAIEEAIAILLYTGLGVDSDDHNFADTPKRVADVYEEMFTPPVSGWPVFDERYTDMVIMRGHQFYTLCPHHLLPVHLAASIAYLPDGKVIGASKLARMCHEANTLPRTQEELTNMVIDKVTLLTGGTSRGAAVFMRGSHGCFQMRGIKSQADFITLKFSGEFAENPKLQERFLNLARL